VTPRAAKLVSRAILLAGVVMLIVSVPLAFAIADRARPGEVVVVGDRHAPGMQDVLDDLENRVAEGDDLIEGFAAGSIALGALTLVWVVTGSLIVSRQPRNAAGWIFCAVGTAFPLSVFAQSFTVYGVKIAPGSVPGIQVAAILGEHFFIAIGFIPLLFLLFPDGRPPSPGWAWATRALLAGLGIATLVFVLQPGPLNNVVDQGVVYENPLGIAAFAGGGIDILIEAAVVLSLAASLSTVIAVRQRFRRAKGEDRQQMRWLVFVATVAGVLVLLWILVIPISIALGLDAENEAPIFPIVFALAIFWILLGVPAAYLVAIMRYRLWDLDVVVRKAVQYAVLVAAFTAVAALVLGVAPMLLFGLGGSVEALPVIVLAIFLAVGFGLVRSRARRLADRIVYGKRATPYEVLTGFSGRMGETYSIDDVLPRMAQVLASGTGATSTGVWLRVGGELRREAAWPTHADEVSFPMHGDALPRLDAEEVFEVRDQGELLGALTVEMPASDPMDPTKEKLVRDLASQAGLVVRNVRLIEDLRASRQRLVAAQDEERRRIERNIHDGAQQQLVALAVQLRLAEQLVGKDPEKERQLLIGLHTAASEALEDLRDLARGIYPPLLADKGLAAALESQARKAPLPVSVESDGIGRYGQDVESAVYFCCLEALNNVAKYAQANRVDVRLSHGEGVLRFEVSDDGHGFDSAAAAGGTGLQGMADRLDAIGGAIDVRSSPGHGTTVMGNVPVRAEGRVEA
jgi:signal transduction histidine kinase